MSKAVFPEKPIVRPLAGTDYVLAEDYYFPATVGGWDVTVHVMPGFRTDGASIPRLLWPIFVSPYDPDIIAAARTLGVSDWRIFWHILIPNTRAGILAGLVLAFTRALGEFGATIMFAGNIPGVTQTMSTAIYAAVQANDYDLAGQWALIIVAFSFFFVGLMNWWTARLNHGVRKGVL